MRARGQRGLDIDPGAIRRARQAAGLSLAQVAGNEITRQAIHLIETGQTRPSMRSLEIIARRLGIPVSAFLAREGTTGPPPTLAEEFDHLARTYQLPRLLETAERVIKGGTSDQLLALAHLHAGQALVQLNRPDDSLSHLRQARRRFESIGNPWMVAEAMDWEGTALYRLNLSGDLELIEEALRRYRLLEPRRAETEARMLQHLGSVLCTRGEYRRAVECLQEALRADAVRDLARVGHLFEVLGVAYFNLGQHVRAIELGERAVALYSIESELNPASAVFNLPQTQNNLAMMMVLDGRLERAEELLAASLDQLERTGQERARSYVVLTLALLRQRQGRLADAAELAGQGLTLANRFKEIRAQADAHRLLGELAATRGAPADAEEHFRSALALLDAAGLGPLREEVLASRKRALGRPRASSAEG
jgi:tetratricopeptide (TPR) repeat protein